MYIMGLLNNNRVNYNKCSIIKKKNLCKFNYQLHFTPQIPHYQTNNTKTEHNATDL